MFLFLAEFVYQNNVHSTIDCNLFYCMYDYNSEIRYEFDDDVFKREMSIVAERVKHLQNYKQELIER